MTLQNTVLLMNLAAMTAWGRSAPVALTSLKPHKVKVEQVTYKGKSAIRVTDAMQPKAEGNEDRVAVLTETSFRDGTIEVEVAGEPGPGAFKREGDLSGFPSESHRTYEDPSVFI